MPIADACHVGPSRAVHTLLLKSVLETKTGRKIGGWGVEITPNFSFALCSLPFCVGRDDSVLQQHIYT